MVWRLSAVTSRPGRSPSLSNGSARSGRPPRPGITWCGSSVGAAPGFGCTRQAEGGTSHDASRRDVAYRHHRHPSARRHSRRRARSRRQPLSADAIAGAGVGMATNIRFSVPERVEARNDDEPQIHPLVAFEQRREIESRWATISRSPECSTIVHSAFCRP